MSILESALSHAFKEFNDNERFSHEPFERGYLLWRARTSSNFLPGQWKNGESNSIRLWDNSEIVAEIEDPEPKNEVPPVWRTKQPIGDYHIHPAIGDWARLWPSTQDLDGFSVLHDFMPLKNSMPNGCDRLLFRLELQLVQVAPFGDVFVLQPLHGREEFSDIASQESWINEHLMTYRLALINAEAMGCVPGHITRSEYDEILARGAKELAVAVGDRAVISLERNMANSADSFELDLDGDE